jgi:hypothetical protein
MMLEVESSADLRLAETKNELWFCESQLRLHRTTYGFVDAEVNSCIGENGEVSGLESEVGGLNSGIGQMKLEDGGLVWEEDVV